MRGCSDTGNMQLSYYSRGAYLVHVLFSQFVFFPINGPGQTSGKPRYKRTVFLIGMERQLLQPKELSVERKVSMLLANCIVLCNLKDPLSCLCEFRSENNTEVYAKPIVVSCLSSPSFLIRKVLILMTE